MSKTAPPNPDQVDLYMPISFWSEHITVLDRRLEFLCERHKFGTLTVKFVVQDGIISQVVLGDEVRVKGTFKKAEVRVPAPTSVQEPQKNTVDTET